LTTADRQAPRAYRSPLAWATVLRSADGTTRKCARAVHAATCNSPFSPMRDGCARKTSGIERGACTAPRKDITSDLTNISPLPSNPTKSGDVSRRDCASQAELRKAVKQRERAAYGPAKSQAVMKRANPTERVSGEGEFLRSLSRGCFAGISRHRTSTTRACVHEGLLLMRRADCIRHACKTTSKKSTKDIALRIL
jgi:hypothetical protein